MQRVNIIFPIFIIILSITASSFADGKFYRNINSGIEFRVIALEKTKLPIEIIPNIHGDLQPVEKFVRINSSDVLGISTNGNQIIIHFKKDSWNKIRKVSLSFQNRKIAIIKNNKIIFAPTMVSTIDRSASLSASQEVNMETLLEGFSSEQKPQNLNSKEIYIKFLKSWINDHPNDNEAIRVLAFEYIPKNDFSNCEGAIPYLEQILKDTPDDMIVGMNLLNCLLESKKNTKALSVAQKLLPHLSDELMKYSLIGGIGEIYYRLGMFKEAIQQVEIALNYFKTTKDPGMADWENYPTDLKEQVKKQFELRKKEAILIYGETLAKCKEKLKE